MRKVLIPWLVGVAGLAAFILGTWGYKHLDTVPSATRMSWQDAAYRSLQLFVLTCDRPVGDKPLPIEIARFLAPAATVMAATLLATAQFKDWGWLFLLRSQPLFSHLVVCGLGRKGMAMVRDARKNRRVVIAIELNAEAPQVAAASALGATVVIGDAGNSRVLVKAGVKTSAGVFIVCGSDNQNVHVTLRAIELARRKIVIMPHLSEAEVRSALRDQARGKRTKLPARKADLNDFCHVELAAREVFDAYPLDFRPINSQSPYYPHLFVIGFGQMGQAVLEQALKIAHYPNGELLHVTLIDPHIDVLWKQFVGRHHNFANIDLADIAQITLGALDGSTIEADRLIETACGDDNALVTIAICLLNDNESIRLAAHLPLIVARTQSVVLMQTHEAAGIHELVEQYRRPGQFKEPPRLNLHAFGHIESSVTLQKWLQNDPDKIARAIHQRYLNMFQPAVPAQRKRSQLDWVELDEVFRDSNRQAADFIPVLFRSFGYTVVHKDKLDHRGPLTPQQVTNTVEMQKLEHRRWYAERYLAGWTYDAAPDPMTLTSDCMVTWEALPFGQRDKDKAQIETYLELLSGSSNPDDDIGLRLVR